MRRKFSCLMGFLLAVAVLGGAGWYVFIREEPVLTATIDVPLTVKQGDAAELVVNLHNPHATTVQLKSIDIDEALLEGFAVEQVEPAPVRRAQAMEQQSYFFKRDVASGARDRVVFTLQPRQPGRYTGRVEVTNANDDIRTAIVDITVE